MTGTLRYVDASKPRGPVYRAFAWLVGRRWMGWVSRNSAWKIDPYLLRLTRGRLGMGMLLPTALLETRGAKSGEPRRAAVVYFHDGDNVILVASHLGLPKNPAWFHNAKTNPDVVLGGQPFRAEVVEDEAQRTRLFGHAANVFPAFADYRERAADSGRTIPLLQLVPR